MLGDPETYRLDVWARKTLHVLENLGSFRVVEKHWIILVTTQSSATPGIDIADGCALRGILGSW